MHTVELLEEAVHLAQRIGYRVRQEWMGGAGSGGCELKGRKWIFLDLALGPREQLDVVVDVLRHDPAAQADGISLQLRQLLQVRKSA